MQLISVITDPGSIGGTFLTWTLHFLSGHTKYFLVEDNSWHDITDSPLKEKNSHAFIPNQPNRYFNCSLSDVKNITEKLISTNTDTFHTLYFHNFNNNLDILVPQYFKDIVTKQVLVNGRNYPLYHARYNPRAKRPTKQGNYIDDADLLYNLFLKEYFQDSKIYWENLGLTNIWDKREFIALNFRPFKLLPQLDFNTNCYQIDSMDLWCNFDLSVRDLFDHLELQIDETKFGYWCSMYHEWKKFHHNNLKFVWQFSTIIQSILKNKYIDLTKFNLDIVQEATIQHELLYKYNLNLKTWQLEKFIDSQQLHSLLEPNIYHKLNTSV